MTLIKDQNLAHDALSDPHLIRAIFEADERKDYETAALLAGRQVELEPLRWFYQWQWGHFVELDGFPEIAIGLYQKAIALCPEKHHSKVFIRTALSNLLERR